MKTLLTILIAAGSLAPAASITTYSSQSAFDLATGAHSITLQASGFESPITGGFYLSLNNPPGPQNETVMLTSLIGLTAFGGTWDTLPEGIGTGVNVYADGQLVMQFGKGVLFQGFAGFSSSSAFHTLSIQTNEPFPGEIQERLTLTGIQGSSVPEPGTEFLLGVGLMALAANVVMRKRKA